MPFYQHNDLVGTYHVGLSLDWLDRQLAVKRGEALRFWGWILGLIAVVVAAAGVSLFQISRRIAILNESVKLQRARRFAEVGQLMAGIAHEIRNPLNAMRLNLHVLQRAAANPDSVGDGDFDTAQIVRETNQEIERVEGLIRILLGYARPDQPRVETLDIRAELQITLGFLKPLLEGTEVAVRARFADAACIAIDRDRLRQILINLMNNASEATGSGGQVDVVVHRRDGGVEIVVSDDGPGVPAADRERVFEPFYSTKENGTGLGLALVRRYVEEAGGTVTCEPNEPRGARFRLRFPDATGAVATPNGYLTHS